MSDLEDGFLTHCKYCRTILKRVKELESEKVRFTSSLVGWKAQAIEKKRADELEKKLSEAKDFAMKYCAPHFQEYMYRLEQENEALREWGMALKSALAGSRNFGHISDALTNAGLGDAYRKKIQLRLSSAMYTHAALDLPIPGEVKGSAKGDE